MHNHLIIKCPRNSAIMTVYPLLTNQQRYRKQGTNAAKIVFFIHTRETGHYMPEITTFTL